MKARADFRLEAPERLQAMLRMTESALPVLQLLVGTPIGMRSGRRRKEQTQAELSYYPSNISALRLRDRIHRDVMGGSCRDGVRSSTCRATSRGERLPQRHIPNRSE